MKQTFSSEILNSVEASIAVINQEGIIIAVNNSWITFASENGVEPGKPAKNTVVGSNYLDVCLSEPGVLDGIRAVLSGDSERFSFEYPCHSPDTQRWFILSATPMNLEERFVVVSHTNITERKQAELQLQQINTAKLACLYEMSAGIAHEINNPLAIIDGSVHLLSKLTNQPEKFSERIKIINQAINRISKILNGLKKFHSTKEIKKFTKHDLSEIIRESLVITQEKAKIFNITITSDLKTKVLIHCDEVEIQQVLLYLINNSIDAVKNIDDKWIIIDVKEEHDSVVIRVTDSGQGIHTNIKAKIFEPFFTTKPTSEGTGLGLSISKGILEEHNASIEIISSEPNTCFEIRFPRLQPAL